MLLPGTLPGRTFAQRGRRSDLLFHWRARDIDLTPLTGQAPTFSRASAGAAMDVGGRFAFPVYGQPRYELVDLNGDGVPDTAGLVLEPARTNSLLWSSDFSNAAWSSSTAFTLLSVPSVLVGQTAQLHTNPNTVGSVSRYQNAGVLSAAGDTVYCLVENVNAVTTDIALYDATTAAMVIRGTFTWASRTMALAAGAGSVFAQRIAEVGPNGGPVYLLAVSGIGTAGDIRRLYLYPTGINQNGNSVVVHHGQLEGGVLFPTSPIVTGAASAARVRDSYEVPFNWPMQDLTIYLRYVSRGNEGHDAQTRVLMDLGQVGAGTRWQIQQAGGAASIAPNISDTGGSTSGGGVSVAAATPGTVVEMLATLDYSPGTQSAVTAVSVTLGGVTVVGATSAARAVTGAFQGSTLALCGISGATSTDWAATVLSAKVAAGLRALTQMQQAF